MQPPADRGVDSDGPATDAASTPTDGWTPPPWSPDGADTRPFWRISAGLLIAGALVLVGAVAGWYFDGNPHDYKLRVDLRVGDCYDLTDSYADQDVKAVQCTTEHEFEVFYVGAMGNGSYPTLDAFADYVVRYCDPAFGDYVGKAPDDSNLDYDWLDPTDDAWRSGDRTVQCAAYDPHNSRLTQSLRGIRQ
jgi:putative regulator of septum formation